MVKASTSITLSAVVDVASCTRYYLLQSSTLSPPAKPTTKPPAGSWNDTEPTYTSGSTNSLYFCDLTVFSDGTWSYSSVSRSSSYEAAKEAYNRAVSAGQTASTAQTVAEHAQSTAEQAQESADTNTCSIQRLDQNVSGLSTQFNVFTSGIEATIEDHSEILSAMSFSTDGLKIQMAGSIYYTLTDDVGYHIYQNDKEIAAFSEGKGRMDELQMGDIIAQKTSRGGWVWTKRDPYPGYVRLEYIANDATNGISYIDTGVKTALNNRFWADVQLIDTNENSQTLWGGRVGNSAPYMGNQLSFVKSSGKMQFAVGSYITSTQSWDTSRHEWHTEQENGQQKVYRDNTLFCELSSSALSGSVNIYLFATDNNGAAAFGGGSMRLYALKIWAGENQVRSFVPYRRMSDGAVGLIDEVNGSFYPGQGEAQFTAGPNV